MTRSPLRLGLIASARYPISQPFAGGLEMHTHALATRLRERGHDVVVFASPDSDPDLGVVPVCDRATALRLSELAKADASMTAEPFLAEHHAYLHLMLRLARERFDVLHNNSLHYLPVAMADTLPGPMVTTLHTPPTPWLESALTAGRRSRDLELVAVSEATAAQWAPTAPVRSVIRNGVDLDLWRYRPVAEQGLAVWTGRIVPEKGPHLAVEAAHAAGLRIELAGPVTDRLYFEEQVRPLLTRTDRYLGHLRHEELAHLVGRAEVVLCTPRWEEPYGLVVAEALACGTPVAAFARGAMPELLEGELGRLAPADDVEALAAAADEARRLDRAACRRHAEAELSVESMVDRYEQLYAQLRDEVRAA